MSLDVYLKINGVQGESREAIFMRANGQNFEVTREEWDKLYPGREPIVTQIDGDDETVYEANITHNLNTMADHAGIYEALWRPEEKGYTHAHQLIEPLERGLVKLKADPAYYKKFNPSNGWGSYDRFVPWVEKYLEACKENPTAEIRVSR